MENMFDYHKPFTFDRVVRLAILVIVCLTLFWLLDYLKDVLIPFVIAALMAYLMHPLVEWFQRKLRMKRRVIPVLLSIVLVFSSISLLTMLIVPTIVGELTHMGELISRYANDSYLAERATKYLPENFEENIRTYVQENEDDISHMFNPESIQDTAGKVFSGAWGIFSGSINVLLGVLGLAIVLMYLVFILLDYDKIMDGWKDLIPPVYRGIVLEVVGDVNTAMSQYFRAQALIASCVGVLFAVGFWLIDLPMGFALGLFIGALNMIPYLQTVGFLPATFFALMHSLETGESFWVMIGLVFLIFVVVQTIQDAVLTPKIMGDATGLNPAVILLALSVWGKLLGMLGLLIAIPCTYLISSYYRRLMMNMQDDLREANLNKEST